MMKLLKKADDNMLALVQECYLWLWDRFGATVGMTLFDILSPSIIIGVSRTWAFLLVGLIYTFLTFMIHVLQTKNMKMFNVITESWRQSPFRYACVAYDVFALATNVISGNTLNFCLNVINMVAVYLWCCKARDRDPPMKHKLALGGAS